MRDTYRYFMREYQISIQMLIKIIYGIKLNFYILILVSKAHEDCYFIKF